MLINFELNIYPSEETVQKQQNMGRKERDKGGKILQHEALDKIRLCDAEFNFNEKSTKF